jgi:DNA-binding LacI/PurR family transcriptional regulator
LPTERELQAEFGVSRSTIRRSLAALIEGGWAQNVPSKGVAAGTGIRKAKSNNIALIHGSTYVLKVLCVRMGEMLRERGFNLVLLGSSIDSLMEDAFEYALQNDFAGALAWPYRGFPDAQVITQVTRQMPVVTLDHRIHSVSTDLVTFNYFEASYQAVDHLVRHGRRRIGVTGLLDMLETTHARFSGYMSALFANGLQPMPADYIFTATSGRYNVDTHLLEQRLRERDRPDALFVLQDDFMPATVEAVFRTGLRIPEDIALVTIGDDIDLTVDGVGVTAIAPDWDAMADEAIRMLFKRIEDPALPQSTRYAPHRLVVRGLCGAPSSEWTAKPEEPAGFHGELQYPRSRYRFSSRWSVQSESENRVDPA